MCPENVKDSYDDICETVASNIAPLMIGISGQLLVPLAEFLMSLLSGVKSDSNEREKEVKRLLIICVSFLKIFQKQWDVLHIEQNEMDNRIAEIISDFSAIVKAEDAEIKIFASTSIGREILELLPTLQKDK